VSNEELRYPLIRRAIVETPWAILPSKLDEIVDFMAFKAQGGSVSVEEVAARFGSNRERSERKRQGQTAILPITGTLSHRMDLMSAASGGASYQSLTEQFRSLVGDPDIDAIVLDVDSPGGSVSGVDELADAIYQARGTKPITAVANSLMASAAYWVASAADEIVATPSAMLGSIGVMAAHEDRSAMMEKLGVDMTIVSAGKYKAENNPFEPMSDEGRAEIQKRVNESYGRFVNAVARHRGVFAETVRDGFGEGRVVGAEEAVALGMADRVGTLDEIVATTTENQTARETAAMARPGAVSFAQDVELVAGEVKRIAQRCFERIEYRSQDGRGLGDPNRERLRDARSQLAGAVASLDKALLADAGVGRDKHRTAMRTLRAVRSADLVLNGVSEGDN
jgi:signal peptide peptidase SppA